jgi:hypothetical protein
VVLVCLTYPLCSLIDLLLHKFSLLIVLHHTCPHQLVVEVVLIEVAAALVLVCSAANVRSRGT